jgi:hypothetical protein
MSAAADWRKQGCLRIRSAAHVLDVSESTLRRGVKVGEVPAVTVAGQLRIPVQWIRERLGEVVKVETKPSAAALEKMGRLVS